MESSSDALDGLYGADRQSVVGTVVNHSLYKGHLQAKKVVAQIIAPQNIQISTVRPYFGIISIPIRLNKTRTDRQNPQDPKNLQIDSKLIQKLTEIYQMGRQRENCIVLLMFY